MAFTEEVGKVKGAWQTSGHVYFTDRFRPMTGTSASNEQEAFHDSH